MPVSQKIGLGLVLTLSVLYGDLSEIDNHLRFVLTIFLSAFGASMAKCVAIANLGKGDLTCAQTPLLGLNTLLTRLQGTWSTYRSGASWKTTLSVLPHRSQLLDPYCGNPVPRGPAHTATKQTIGIRDLTIADRGGIQLTVYRTSTMMAIARSIFCRLFRGTRGSIRDEYMERSE
jgi:hypothetical protein